MRQLINRVEAEKRLGVTSSTLLHLRKTGQVTTIRFSSKLLRYYEDEINSLVGKVRSYGTGGKDRPRPNRRRKALREKGVA